MSKPLHTITRDVQVGIYENCEYIARVYADKIIVLSPHVKWVGNSGGYAEARSAIREPKNITAILADLADDCEDDAWAHIGAALDDDYLANASF